MMQRLAGSRGLRYTTIIALVAVLVGGVYVLTSQAKTRKIVGYFTSAVGLYPGDQVRVLGVPVGTIDTIDPRPTDVKITMSVSQDVKVPKDAKAIIMSPNLVAARFIQLTPAYTGGPVLADGASIGLDRTAVPVEWDEVKQSLTQLAVQLGPTAGSMQGPLGAAINQAADTFDGKGESFHSALRELSQAAGRLGDSRGDIFGTVKNLQILVNALSSSNEQIVQFAGNVASVSQVLADSSRHLDTTLGTLNKALSDIRGFLHENNSTIVDTVNNLNDFAKTLSDQSDNIEQVLHVAGPGIANFYNIYDPAQGTLNGLLSIPEFANPVQFICGGSFETAGGPRAPDYYKRAELCRERLGPVLRRLTVNYPPLMFHPLNTITAYKGQIIYDTPETQAKSATPVPQLTWIPAKGAQTPPAVQNPADLQALLVPTAPQSGPAPAGGAPARARPGSAFGPRPGPPPARRPAGWAPTWAVADEPNVVARRRIGDGQHAAGRLPVRRAELAGDARHRRSRQRRLLDHRRTAGRGDAAAELPGDGGRRHRRQRRRYFSRTALRRIVLCGSEIGAGQERGAAGQLDRDGRPDLAARLDAHRPEPPQGQAGRRPADRRVEDRRGQHRSLPHHRRGALGARCRGEQGQCRCAGRDHRRDLPGRRGPPGPVRRPGAQAGRADLGAQPSGERHHRRGRRIEPVLGEPGPRQGQPGAGAGHAA
ncbi:mce related family protein [Mycobacterium avium subsp. avium 2285 (R)]|nr:mce related family protein [Mycobacterium avium subsp. avium 2285 (R)]